MLLHDAMTEFLRHCRYERELSELTLRAYDLDLQQFRRCALGGSQKSDVRDIGKAEIRAYLEQLSHQYKPRSTKRKIATLKAFFSFLEQEDAIEATPFRKLHVKLERARSLPRIIAAPALQRLLQAAYDHCRQKHPGTVAHAESLRDIAVIELLYCTGIRVSELCSLADERVDLNKGCIIVTGKGKRERIIPICEPATLQALQNYKTSRGEATPPSPFFTSRRRTPLSDQSVRRIINKYRELGRVEQPVTPHMFRHTIATQLLENGVDIRNIQTMLGHSSLAVTEIYTHVSLAAQREAIVGKHPRGEMEVILG